MTRKKRRAYARYQLQDESCILIKKICRMGPDQTLALASKPSERLYGVFHVERGDWAMGPIDRYAPVKAYWDEQVLGIWGKSYLRSFTSQKESDLSD